jgi:type I restriction enzyme M protein
MDGKQDYDVLGFIYEYLISMFAANAGKKAGEFYTPHEVSLLMSEIIAHHLKNRSTIKIYEISLSVLIKKFSAPQTVKAA